MTGYGKAEAQLESGKLTVEIRSLNAKSADINIKSTLLPKDKDLSVRRKLAERLQRGTIEELEKMIRPHLPRKVPCVFISSSTGQGLQELKDMLWKALQA